MLDSRQLLVKGQLIEHVEDAHLGEPAGRSEPDEATTFVGIEVLALDDVSEVVEAEISFKAWELDG